jgi:hypothetical protein
MDIAQFAAMRPARAIDPKRVNRLVKSIMVPVGGGMKTHVPSPVTLTPETLPEELGDPAADPLTEYADIGDASVIQRIHAALRGVERALAEANDRLDGNQLKAIVATALKKHRLDTFDWAAAVGGEAAPTVIWPLTLMLLYEPIRNVMTGEAPDYERAVRLNRLALVANLLCELTQHLPELSADDIFALVHRRPVVMPGCTVEEVNPQPRIHLVRDVTVRDLQVLRREWAGYLPGEIANVRNMMAGESFTQHDLSTRETETTTTTSTERREVTDTEAEDKQTSELASSISNSLGVTINGHVEGSVDAKYPVVTAHVGGSVDAGLTLQRSDQQSSKIAREAVARATSHVDSLTRESRMQRELTRTEQGFDYSLRNATSTHMHGVYRWVDRVDTYQMFRYTDRLQLEFQIPEPAEFYRWRTDRAAKAAGDLDKPPEWTLKAKDITPDKLIELAATFRATNLPPPPDAQVTVVRTLSVAPAAETSGGSDKYNPPAAAKELDIPIPSDYISADVMYEGEGVPVVGEFNDEQGNSRKAARFAFAAVAIGSSSTNYFNGGIWYSPTRFVATHGHVRDIGTANSVQVGGPPYGRAFLPIGSDAGLDPNPVKISVAGAQNVLKVAVTTVGLLACTVTFALRCVLSASAMLAWQLGVYDALFAAWEQWRRDYESRQVRQELMGQSAAADAGSSQRNEQVIREELKRELIAWLLDEEHFAGRSARQPRSTDPMNPKVEIAFGDVDTAKAILNAPTIQFLEQAFEWSNLGYVFYPYFWADRFKWEHLSQIRADDPQFEAFLRAGSARVVLPARPVFEDAVRNWLMTGRPFINGQLPCPDNKLFISIDTEVREILSPQDGGIPGDHWQTRLSTTMLYLERQGDLPFTNDNHQLPAPVGIPYQPSNILVPKPGMRQGAVESNGRGVLETKTPDF